MFLGICILVDSLLEYYIDLSQRARIKVPAEMFRPFSSLYRVLFWAYDEIVIEK